MNERELLKQLIDALDKELPHKMQHIAAGQRFNARAALAQPEQEPDDLTIAYMSGVHDGKKQRTWVGLTEEEISDATKDIRGIHCVIVDEIARAIEAKLKEKNT